MAASKRNFDNFEKFPGKVNAGTGYHEFPTVTSVDSASRKRIWSIYIRLIKSDGPRLIGIDWNLLDEKQVPIKPKYYGYGDTYADLPKGTIVQVWVSTGIVAGKITRNSPTYFEKIALSGQVNQRNQLHQALIYARSQWLKRKEKHKSTSGKSSKSTSGKSSKSSKSSKSGKSSKSSNNKMYFPMLATTEAKGVKHLDFPVIVQPKLDGTRAVAYLQSKDGGAKDVIIYTRTKKIYPDLWYLQVMLYPYLNDLYDDNLNQSIYLDGELYKHGKALQDISGSVRRSKKNRLSKRSKDNDNDNTTLEEANEYHIYDCFYPLELDTAYESRREQLQELFNAMSVEPVKEFGFSPADVIKPVSDWTVDTIEEATARFKTVVAQGYEGIIMRNLDAVYAAGLESTTGTRRKDLVKMKKQFTDEFELVGYTQGSRGKDRGALIWIAQTESGDKFNVTPKDMTYEKRYELFLECEKSFDEKYLGRMLTVEHEGLSKALKPLRAKALVFRDYE